MKKRCIMCLLICLFLLTASCVYAESIGKYINVHFNSINIAVNGQRVDAQNILYEGTTYVPLKRIAELFGKTVKWNGETRTADISAPDVTREITEDNVHIPIGNNEISIPKTGYIEVYFDSINITVNSTAVQAGNILFEGTTYVPLKAVAEMLGKEVAWDAETRTASINEPAGAERRGKGIGCDHPVVMYGGSLYISNYVNDIPLLRINMNDNSKTVITSDDRIYEQNVLDDWIYYTTGDSFFEELKLYKVSIEGENKVLLGKERFRDVEVINDHIFYGTDTGEIYRMDTDGKNKTMLVDSTRFGDIIATNGWIYYEEFDEEKRINLYRIRYDGTCMQKLIEQSVDSWDISDGWIYFSLNEKMVGKSEKLVSSYEPLAGIYIQNLDTNQRIKIYDGFATGIDADNGWVYFTNRNSGIYRVRTDGSEFSCLSEDIISYFIDVIDGWVYYDLYTGCDTIKLSGDGATRINMADWFFRLVASGTSMLPTIHDKEYMLFEKGGFESCDRFKTGDIIAFKHKFEDGEELNVVKRVIGKEGQHVEIRNGKVYIDGVVLKEDYLKPGTRTKGKIDLVVPEGTLFVLGDNRESSNDSRYKEFGPIKISKVFGILINVYE